MKNHRTKVSWIRISLQPRQTSSHHTQKRCDKRILRHLHGRWANRLKIRIQRCLGQNSPHVGEGETGSSSDFMSAIRHILQPIRVDPSQCGSHHTEVEMIGHCFGIASLRLCTTNLLLDLLEPGFNLPASAIVLDDLFNGE